MARYRELKTNKTMKKIIFIAMFCIVILGAFAANASKATENNKPEPKISTGIHLVFNQFSL